MGARLHDRDAFYKYSSIGTALRVIEGRSFRWSSPTKFNDPFDHRTGFVVNATAEVFAQQLTTSIERMVFSDMPLRAPTNALGTMTGLMRLKRDSLPRAETLRDIREACMVVAQGMPTYLGKLNGFLVGQLCHSRVFCVSETPDNVVMWSHYAEEHRGVVFKLRCMDDLDNTLLAAKPVIYSSDFLSLTDDPAEYAKHLTDEARLDFDELVWRLAFHKHADWSYEREWRVHVALINEPVGDGYTVYKESPQVFEAVYLGCRVLPEDAERISNAVRQHLPATRIYATKRSRTSFGLEFQEVHGVA